MGVELLTERHAAQIAGVLGCWDRMLVFGTLPKICFADGMTSFLYERKIRIFDYPKHARTRQKVGHSYKYYVTAFGKEVVATALKLRELVIIPQFALGLTR